MNNIAALIEAAAFVHPGGAPDAELVGMLARFLGIAPASVVSVARRSDVADQDAGAVPELPLPEPSPASDIVRPRGPTPDRSRSVPHTPTARAAGADGALQARPSVLRKVTERADLAPDHRTASAATNDRRRSVGDADVFSAPVESLFAPNRVRSILGGLATVSIPSGEPDIIGIVDLVARGIPASRLPERTVNTLGHAIELLFDVGPAMLPFSRDKQQLASAAVRLIGKDRVRVADFIDDPLQGVRMQRSVRWQPFGWPDRRSTIIVISDLGIGSGDAHGGLTPPWSDFLRQAVRRQVRTVALIPYSATRWPPQVVAFDAALPWDLPTGVQALRRALRLRRYAT